ncbi:MAG: tyrosine-type recombinase/integrase, partial [Ignavibacteriales bacterium]|nr:tyrosine-type recombinase/integrase [Ignavibacteriales bacterium]
QARHLSPNTIRDYTTTLRKLNEFLNDPPIDQISTSDLRKFLAAQIVSNKTIYNYHIGLSVFFKWCVSEGFIEQNPLAGIPRPKPEQRTIQPIPKEHILKILQSIERVSYKRDGKTITAYLPDRYRNRAIILLLLDTGLRASELCSITRKNLDLARRSVKIIGKNNKERILYFSPTTAQAIWKMDDDTTDYLFSGSRNRPLDRDNLRHILERACDRADVPLYSPHDFRHTFAVNFLRNYPNIYALQQMLGHSTLDMVKRYLAISESDIAEAHKHASPVENWGL